MEITEAELGWIMGCLLLLGLVLAYPSIMTVLALLREERLLGRLYWPWRALPHSWGGGASSVTSASESGASCVIRLPIR